MAANDEYVVSLAALALYDGNVEITSENLSTLITSSGNKVQPYWPALFAGFLKGGKIDSVIATGGAVGGGGAAAAPAASESAAGPAKEEKKEKPKVEEVDALDGGMDMFGGGGSGGGSY